LEELGEGCLTLDPSLRPLVDRVVPLTEYAWKFRYPGEPANPSATDVDEALAAADQTLTEVRARVPAADAP
jgi:hypothetical protein